MNLAFRLLRWLGIRAALLVAVVAPASLRASDFISFPPAPYDGMVIADPAGNLSGDPSRGYMDLVQSSLWEGDTEFILEVRMAAPFPTAREMAGGKRLDIIWFVDIDRNRATGQSADGNDYNIHLLLDESGWHDAWYKVSTVSNADGIRILPSAFSYAASGDRAWLTFPKAYLPSRSFEFWAICFSANAPNWTPLTQNPPTRRAVYDLKPTQSFVVTVDETARKVDLTVFRRDRNGTATVDYATVDGSARGGEDFAATSGTVIFPVGQTNQTITIPLLNDGVTETNESFSVRLMNPSAGASLGLRASATIVILDNDRGFEFSQSSVTVDEFARQAVLTVLRQGDSNGPATVDFATADGTALGGRDYEATSGTLVFLAGQTNQTLTIPLLNDGIVETNETLSVRLMNPSAGASLGVRASATLVIRDNDRGFEFSQSSVTVDEFAGQAVLTVLRQDDLNGPATVDFATADGTALGGKDYAAASGTLVFLAGQTNQIVTIPLLDDRPKDVTKAFTVRLSHPSEGTSLGAAVVVTVVVTRPPEVIAWGMRYNGSSWLPATTPTDLSGVVAIAAGEHHNLALLRDGRVAAWDVGRDSAPGIMGGLTNVVAIAAGSSANLALTAEGRVLAWEVRGGGPAVEVQGWNNIVAIAAGGAQQLALTAEGRVRRLGGPDVPEELAAEQPGAFPFHRVTAIAAGYTHSLALTAEGRVMAWGANMFGQTGVPAGLTNIVAIAAGEGHSLALTGHGEVVAWGRYYHGANTVPMTVPAGLSNVVSIAAGKSHGLALTTEGKVVGFGASYGGSGMVPMTVPENLNNVVAIAAGGAHSLALLDGPPGRTAPEWITPRFLVGTLDHTFHQRATVKNGAAIYGATGLPPGLVLDSATGLVSGVPTRPGTYSVALFASNSVGVGSTTATFSINQPAAPVISAPAETVVIGAGSTFRYQVVAHHEPERFSAVGLPRGLNIDEATGEIMGTPVETGEFEVNLAAENRYGLGSALLKLRVSGPVLHVPEDRVVAALGSPFRYQVAADHLPEKFTAIGLPPGLFISESTGEITGTPLEEGNFEVTLSAGNRFGTASGQLTIQVSALVDLWGTEIPPPDLSHVVAFSERWTFGIFDSLDYHRLVLSDEGRVTEWKRRSFSPLFEPHEVPVAVTNVVAIAAGGRHSLALTADGQVIEWNLQWRESDGTPSIGLRVPNGLSNVVAIATGNSGRVALTAAGRVVAWDESGNADMTLPADLGNVVAIAAGTAHYLALTAAGRVVAWGSNESGQANVPVSLTNAVAIAAGDTQSLALTADGRVVEWGEREWWDWVPLPAGLSNVIAISAGQNFHLALTDENRVVAWGLQQYVENTPDVLRNVVAIDAGTSLALTSLPPDTAPPAWFGPRRLVATTDFPFHHRIRVRNGATSYGAAGLPPGLTLDGVTGLISGVPERTGTYPIVFSATNRVGSCAWEVTLFVNAAAPFVANRELGSVGLGTRFEFPVTAYNEPQTFAAHGLPAGLDIDARTGIISGRPLELGDFEVSLTASNRHGIGTGFLTLRVSPLVAWGRSYFGGGASLDVPGGLSHIVSVAAGHSHSMALTAEGRVIVWGEERQTQMPEGLGQVVAIAAGSATSMALTADGRVVEWGWSPNAGPVWTTRQLRGVVAIAAGSEHGLALTAEGQVVAWGDNRYGQASVPAELKTKKVVAIAAGNSHNLALTDEGRVMAWGNNTWGNQWWGQTNAPQGLSNVVTIAAGDHFSLALTTEGRVVAWGGGGSGVASVPAGLSNVVSIAAGSFTALAITAEGRVVVWGNSENGLILAPDVVAEAVSITASGQHGLALMHDPSVPVPRLTLSRTDAGVHLQAVGESGIACQLLRASELSGPWLPTQAVTFTNRVQTLRTLHLSQHTQFFRLRRK